MQNKYKLIEYICKLNAHTLSDLESINVAELPKESGNIIAYPTVMSSA